MRATTNRPVFYLFGCLACCCFVAPLAAADSPDGPVRSQPQRKPRSAAAKGESPRLLPTPEAGSSERGAAVGEPSAAVEQAAFSAKLTTPEARSAQPQKSAAPHVLPPRGAGKSPPQDGQAAARGRASNAASSVMTGLASLAVVLGLFFAVAWAMRRGMPPGPAALPREAVEVLGRTPLAGRQQAHLIRCGNKVLLVYLAQGVAETLTEITDPVEVDRLVGLCRQTHPQSATASFRQILQQFSREKPAEA